ncbi:hypothetical protein ScPMuIL_006371 [Solemya velum]
MPTIPPAKSDWQAGKSLMECTRFMFENEIACDVTFLVGGAKDEVRAHKFILISRSPVFSAMFCGPMAESQESIPIPDIHADNFRTMLRYMYCDKENIDDGNVSEVLYCAKKYCIAGLSEACRKYLSENINTTNSCLFLQIADKLDEQDLCNECLEYILEDGERCFQSESFKEMSRRLVEKVVEADDLVACELSVWEALVTWSEAECERQGSATEDKNVREAMGDLAYFVRFRGIDTETFAKKVTSREILTGDEIAGIFRFCHHVIKQYDKFSMKRGRSAIKSPLVPEKGEGTWFEAYQGDVNQKKNKAFNYSSFNN